MVRKYGRLLADMLTLLRVILSAGMVWMGWAWREEALAAVVVALTLAWLTDILDGPLARRSDAPPTWISRHEAEADMTMSLGVLGYLILSGFLAPLIGVPLAFLIAGLWLYSYLLAWPVYVIPYVILFVIVYRYERPFAWVIAGYMMIALALRASRLRREYLPAFVHALRRLVRR